MFKGSFSYKNNNINVVEITNNSFLRIERLNQNVARIYFVDQNENQIIIPNNTICKDIIANENINQFQNNFIISWVSNYEITINDMIILILENQKQQSIKTNNNTNVIQQ